MILVDSIYINDSGGLILLKYLVDVLEKSNVDVFYLFDERTLKHFNHIDTNNRVFLKNSIIKRYEFYIKNRNRYTSVFCFGNVPPPIKLKVPTYVYFHQQLFLEIPKNFTGINKVLFTTKQIILNFYKNNASVWMVQSQLMRDMFAKKYLKGDYSNIEVLPFYPHLKLKSDSVIQRRKNSFIYVSNGSSQKNHRNLIYAFCNAYDKTKAGFLLLTLPSSSTELCELISSKIELGYPIINIGFINRNDLTKLYLSHEYLIFPSLAESFGLGLVEAIDCGCKVLVSDLPYAYEVCTPSLTFDPYNIKSIEEAIIIAIEESLPKSEKLISNNINNLISILAE